MKLLLTSAGFENPKVGEKFVDLVGKPASKMRVIFVPTASRTKEELKYVDEAKKELLNIGVQSKNIKTLHLDHHISYGEVKEFDVIYVCGGNTFFLLSRVRETGFDKVIKQFLKEAKVYVGVSAGSILVGPNTEIAIPYDENDVGITDFSGLHLIDVIITPHYTPAEKKTIDKYRRQSGYKVVPLTDRQAYLVVDNGFGKIFS